MNKLIYISSFIPKKYREDILKSQKIYDGNSAEVLSRSIFHGLVQNNIDFTTINISPIGPYPRCNKNIYYEGSITQEEDRDIIDIPFYTLLGYQHYSISINVYKTLKTLLCKERSTDLLLYSINISALNAIKRLKAEGYQIRLFLIILDFWDDMLRTKNFRNRLKSLFIPNVQNYYPLCDGYILLTKEMINKIDHKSPFCVVEGMYDSNEERPKPIIKNNRPKVIFYSGMLHEKFGIKQLVEVIHNSDISNVLLKICGSGDFENQLKEYSRKDSRIQYMGLINRNDVLKEQYNADILINPRTADGEFTKYSFPSKTIEYFASGTPTILHRLPGIPDEYYKYCFTFESSNNDDIKRGIENVLQLSPNRLYQVGIDAQHFIFSNKTSQEQTKKIIDFIKNKK